MSMEAWYHFNSFCMFGIMIVAALFCTITLNSGSNRDSSHPQPRVHKP